MAHYALVSRSEPLVVDKEGETGVSYQEELEAIYQSYAELYPNTRLAEEFRERDQLLAQAAAIQARRNQQDNPEKPKKQSGIGRFFRFWNKDENDQGSSAATDSTVLADNVLEYSDPVDEDSSTSLCGAGGQLDHGCIPQEAHSAARFHLASTRTRRDRPVVVRSLDSFPTTPSKAIVIVGIGRIAEFQEKPAQEDNSPVNNDTPPLMPIVKHTSDREDLSSYASSLETPFELSYVRATSLGPNFLAVSWGLADGIVVMYRRMSMPNLQDVGWESVAMFGPTPSTLENLRGSGDLFTEDANGQMSCSLLRVTDLVPLAVEHPVDESGSPKEPAAALAVSRLGGYLELLPLTPRLWYGPVLTPENHKHKPRPTRKRKRRSNEPPEHYCIGKLFNLSSEDRAISALTTFEHHVDLICMDIHRVQSLDSSSASFILAACGTSKGRENVTFWGVQTAFDGAVGQSGFSLRASLLDKIDIGPAGADISIFTNEAIWKQWRRPRRVRLRRIGGKENDGQRDAADVGGSLEGGISVDPVAKQNMGTLSTPAPISCLSFGSFAPRQEEAKQDYTGPSGQQPRLMMAALDWNGCITIIDCNGVLLAASHPLPPEARDGGHRQSSPGDSLFGFCRIRFHRNRGGNVSFEARNSSGHIVDVCWWTPMESMMSSIESCLAMITARGELRLLDLSVTQGRELQSSCALDLSSISQASTTLAIVDSTKRESLSVLLDRHRRHEAVGGDASGSTGISELSFCAMQRLDPLVIVQSLAQSGRYSEAIAAVETVSPKHRKALTQVINTCFKSLWEKEHDAKHLHEITDDVYVVKQALTLYRKNVLLRHVDIDSVKSATMIGLERAKKMLTRREDVQRQKLGDMTVDGPEVTESTVAELMRSSVCLCTYEILSHHFGNPATFERFKETTLDSKLTELAVSFAKKGDIAALTILFVRHEKEIVSHRLDVLNHIPFAINVSCYCHLLPVRVSQRDGENFFVPIEASEGKQNWSQMARYIGERSATQFFLDPKDEKLVMEWATVARKEDDKACNEEEDDIVGRWYVERARDMQRSLGNLSAVIQFCDLALQRLPDSPEPSSDSQMRGYNNGIDSSVRSLMSLRASANLMNQMLNEGVLLPAERMFSSSAALTMTTEELLHMHLPDLVSMILGETSDPLEVFSKYKSFLEPLLSLSAEATSTEQESEQDLGARMDRAIASYCLQTIHKAVSASQNGSNDATEDTGLTVSKVRDALAVCTTVANASRTTIRRSDRIVKEKKVLMNLVLSVAYDSVLRLGEISLSNTDRRYLVDMLWEMYECLPRHESMLEASNSEIKSIQERVDGLYCHLIALDLLVDWTQDRAFSLVLEFTSIRDMREEESEHQELMRSTGPDRNTVGLKMVSKMCRGFCQLLGKDTDPSSKKRNLSLLHDVLADVDQMNGVCFRGSLPYGQIFQSHLLRPLLELEHFHLFVDMLNSEQANWFDKRELQASLLAFVKEAMFAGDGLRVDGNRVQAAILCQDMLGPFFPDIQSEFHNMRRYLDAASFIGTVLCSGHESAVLHPRDIQDKPPLDVLEFIMMKHPQSVVAGCTEWKDVTFAVQATSVICQHFRSAGEKSPSMNDNSFASNNLPPLPGGAIFHLAKILGLDSQSSHLIIKSRVAHHAVRGKLYGASAAVCMSLVCDPASRWQEDPDVGVRLEAVAEIVSTEEYEDLHIKKELCTAVLHRWPGKLSVCNIGSFAIILRTFSAVESRLSQFRNETQVYEGSPSDANHDNVSAGTMGASEVRRASQKRSDFLVFRAADIFSKTAQTLVGGGVQSTPGVSSIDGSSLYHIRPSDRIYQYILSNYATDIRELFSELHRHMLNEVEKPVDPLLHTLCRLVMFWCISDSIRTDAPESSEEEYVRDMLGFGISLLLHIQDKASALSLVKELQNTVVAETTGQVTVADPTGVSPDADIVRRLRGRGYSENGAHRSAVAVNNESYESALGWAVSHSLDSSFDDPIVLMKSGDSNSFVDQGAIRQIQDALSGAYHTIEGNQQTNFQDDIRARDGTAITTILSTSNCTQTPGSNGHAQQTTTPAFSASTVPPVPRNEEQRTSRSGEGDVSADAIAVDSETPKDIDDDEGAWDFDDDAI